jgi:hypothetical protein
MESTESRQQWGPLLNQVFRRERRVHVEQDGLPVAAIVSSSDIYPCAPGGPNDYIVLHVVTSRMYDALAINLDRRGCPAEFCAWARYGVRRKEQAGRGETMQWDEFGRQWQVLTEEVLTGMEDWRTAHPKATFLELEAAVDERLGRMRARMLEAAAMASTAADVSGSAAGERRTCPESGQTLVARGQRERRLQVPGGQSVQLRRSYTSCSACGAGLFPP